MRVLIAYDGSKTSVKILTDLKTAGLPLQCHVIVLSVAELAHKGDSDEIESARLLASTACDQIKVLFPNWEIEPIVKVGYPPQEILALSNEWKADLIIVGLYGYNALGRFLLGSVAHKVVTSADCSVRVAREYDQTDIHSPRILIGVDGSRQSIAAMDCVIRRIWPKDTEVRLITAVDSESVEKITHAQELQNLLKDKMDASGLKFSCVIRSGDARQALLHEAKHWLASSIFVGSKGLGPLERLLLGSVSMTVVEHAHCPVEVVRD